MRDSFSNFGKAGYTLLTSPAASTRNQRKLWAILSIVGTVLILTNTGFRWSTPSLIDDGYFESESLANLGQIAEDRYQLIEDDLTSYTTNLEAFLEEAFPATISARISQSMFNYMAKSSISQRSKPAMVSYPYIHQTDKKYDPANKLVAQWQGMNQDEGWEMRFRDDDQSRAWLASHLEDAETGEPQISDISWAWDYMKRGVMKADFLRYLVIMLDGGVYSDVDTYPLRPIMQWGKTDVHHYDISATDGNDWEASVNASEPSVIIGIDVDVHKRMDWHKWWPRPLGICQWTLTGAPHHPIYIDAVRRVVNATRYIQNQVDVVLPLEIDQINDARHHGWQDQIHTIQEKMRTQVGILPIMDHTGPGIWTDAVLSYLLARYKISWHELRGLEHPLRIGEVMLLPITALSPGGDSDFGDRGTDDVQADVVHTYRGSWKSEGL